MASQFSRLHWSKQLDKKVHGGLIVRMTSHAILRERMVEIGRRLYDQGLIAAADGNISCRLPDGKVLITPSGKAKGRLSPDDLVIIDLSGKVVAGSHDPSSEYKMHTAFYTVRDNIRAVVHAHPVYCTAYAVAGMDLVQPILPEVLLSIGEIPLAEYGAPSTSELAASVERLARDHDTILLRSHGLVAAGGDLEEAYNRIELAEHFARILHAAEAIGGARTLSDEQVEALMLLKHSQKRESTDHPAVRQTAGRKE